MVLVPKCTRLNSNTQSVVPVFWYSYIRTIRDSKIQARLPSPVARRPSRTSYTSVIYRDTVTLYTVTVFSLVYDAQTHKGTRVGLRLGNRLMHRNS